jgi:hypothetical protein
VSPDFDVIHATIADAITKSESGAEAEGPADEPEASTSPSESGPAESPGPSKDRDNPSSANTTDDLAKAC